MNVIKFLIETQNKTVKCFSLLPGDLSKTYAPGKWTIREILVYLADAESILHERIKRIIAEPKQVIWAFDQDSWCDKLEYENFPLDVSRNLYIANRQSILYLADRYYETLGAKEFIHSQTGLRTLKDEIDKVATHNQGHLKQIEVALLS